MSGAPPPTDFLDAVAWFTGLVAQVRAEQWDEPGLGEWTVRELVAHASRAMTSFERYLGGRGEPTVLSAGHYFGLAPRGPEVHIEIAERGKAEAANLGDDPLAALQAIAARIVPLLGAADADDLCTLASGGTIRLSEYLRTRIVELVVHGIDLADAIGVPADPPSNAVRVTLEVLADAAWRRGDQAATIRALTGRGPGVNILG